MHDASLKLDPASNASRRLRGHVRGLALGVLAALLTVPSPGGSAVAASFFTETVQTGGFVGTDIAVAVDDRGTPHVAYWDLSNFFLMYATRANGVWNTEVIEAAVFLGSGITIAVDAQHIPQVVFHEASGGGGALRHASRAGGSWTVNDVDVTVANVGLYPAAAIDTQGRLHVSYHDATSGDLKYALLNGAWAREVADGGAGIGLYSDIALDGSDRPHISYVDDNGELYYATKIGTSWYRENLPGAATVAPTGIGLDPTGTPVLASTGGGFLNVHTRSGTTWALVGGAAAAGGASYGGGLGVDAEGRVIVPFRDVVSKDLHIAEYTPSYEGGFLTGQWTAGPLVQTGTLVDIGVQSDLALDPYGSSVVAYSDVTNGDAMIADGGVRLSTALTGITWPVGAKRTIAWKGAGRVDLLLSVNGGASYQELATELTGGSSGSGGEVSITVPHAPSHFCKIKILRGYPFAVSESESLFTIETSVSLLSLLAAPLPGRAGTARVTWRTDPGPADLAGYRLEKAALSETWRTVVPMTKETSYTDESADGGARYRLFAVNGLGEELMLGETSLGPPVSLAAWPTPYRDGTMRIDFATASGLGGAAATTDVSLYDVRGRLVRVVDRGEYGPGHRSAVWNGRDRQDRPVPAGIYFLQSRSAGQTETLKLTVLR